MYVAKTYSGERADLKGPRFVGRTTATGDAVPKVGELYSRDMRFRRPSLVMAP